MLTFEQARQLALAKIGDDCALVDSAWRELANGWYFAFQTRAYLETGNEDEMLIGNAGFVVAKEDGRIFDFSSAFSLERSIAFYEAGFRFETYDLTVTRIHDPERTLALFLKLKLRRMPNQVTGALLWEPPKNYERDDLAAALDALPATFRKQNLTFAAEVFEQIDAAQCCEYELHGYYLKPHFAL